MTDELEAACERLEQYKSAAAHNLQVAINDTSDQLMELPYGMPMRTIPAELLRDYRVASDAYLADCDRRKREAEERALLVDGRWFRSIGAEGLHEDEDYIGFATEANGWVLAWSESRREWSMFGNVIWADLDDGPNRGQVLNLLSAFSIPIPQKPEVPCDQA